jgi:PKD repeat protein
MLRGALLIFLAGLVLLPAAQARGQQAQAFPLPVAPVTGVVGQPVTFTAAVTGAAANALITWDFGDGQSATGATVSHVYQAPGVYTVGVTAVEPDGAAVSTATTASIAQPSIAVNGAIPGGTNPSPLGFIGTSINGPYTGTAGTPILFTATAVNDAAAQFTWQFGDGSSASGAAVYHAYQAPGTYTVHLTAVDPATGASGSSVSTVTIGGAIAGAPPAGNTSAPVVSYPAGWNLIAGPAGTPFPQAESPIYTWQPGDTTYEARAAAAGVQAGEGYWAYFPQPAVVPLSGFSSDTYSVVVPAGQSILIGNPSATHAVTVHGADSVTIWDAVAQRYSSASSLAPGAGAWVSVAAGGTVTLSP